MKIIIKYESSWRNSFLQGSNNEPPPKQGREFIASMTNLKEDKNFISREITIDTVMGILNRLIGDQRKLYQSREDPAYFFKNLESCITFDDSPKSINEEMVYLRNMKGSTDQNSFAGMIKTQDPMFNSDYTAEFWGILALNFTELCEFIIHETQVTKNIAADPLSIIEQLEKLDKEKTVANEGIVEKALQILNVHFPDAAYLNKKGDIKPLMFYCSSLYLQLERLAKRFDMSTVKTKAGGISGISKRGFTKKDFMAKFTTGEKKRIFGNPYIKKSFVKGKGEVTSTLTKAHGSLEIKIDVDKEKSEEIRRMIECAGVSSFYLGKKGLAYVEKLRV